MASGSSEARAGDVQSLKRAGNDAYADGKFDDALGMYMQALEQNPEANEKRALHSNASLMHLKMGKPGLSLIEAEKGIETDPTWFRNYIRKTNALLALGRHKDALAAAIQAQDIMDKGQNTMDALKEMKAVRGEASRRVHCMTPLLSEQQVAPDLVSPKQTLFPRRPTWINMILGTDLGGPASLGKGMYDLLRDCVGGHVQLCSLCMHESEEVWQGRTDEEYDEAREEEKSQRGFFEGQPYVSSVCIGDERDFLQVAEEMGPPPRGWTGCLGTYEERLESGELPDRGARRFARLREVVEELPWSWYFRTAPVLVKEFRPVAVAILLRRWDWLTEDQRAVVTNLEFHLSQCKKHVDASIGSLQPGDNYTLKIFKSPPDFDTGSYMLPLLRAALFCPDNPVWQREALGYEAFQGLSGEGAGVRALEKLQKYAEAKGTCVPSLVFEGTRRWASNVANLDDMVKLEFTTNCALHGEGLELWGRVLRNGVQTALGKVPAYWHYGYLEEGYYVTFREGTGAWYSPASWAPFLPRRFEKKLGLTNDPAALYNVVESGDARGVKQVLDKWRAAHGGRPFDENKLPKAKRLKDGATLLHLCGQLNHAECARLLIELGGYDVNKASTRGHRALHSAALAGSADAARLLLEKGADPCLCDWEGNSPLHDACWNGTVDVVRVLVEHPETHKSFHMLAAPPAPGAPHLCPLDNACVKGHIEIVQLLLDAGFRFKTGPPPPTANTGLDYAAQHGLAPKASVRVAKADAAQAFYARMLLCLESFTDLSAVIACVESVAACHPPPDSAHNFDQRMAELKESEQRRGGAGRGEGLGGAGAHVPEEGRAPEKGCFACGKAQVPGAPKMLACSRCRAVIYCGAECQKADWKRHKLECSK